ncbi:ATP-binding cassette protein subfamily G [Perkinsela sp. CCAP 1560/4]|nr:ATP-binding cassette protein subfamily G [Perkinsela sp. CCAP 1560/4]|eukprot:KNH06987.1 ATP-binding cassette protein subfamily G [Perkinsela sp. CCAP 1560/4]
MGPSGSGKTTLLNFLSGRLPRDSVHLGEGMTLFNGEHLSPSKISHLVSYVAQDDIVFDFDTPREALYFSVRIRNCTSHNQAQDKVQLVLDQMGLGKCADTIIGNPQVQRGVSGGERKRVNIGVELITDPRVILLDEPTTGLDSVNALRIVLLLKKLAHECGNTIICSIHQPSSEIFAAFDDLLLLANGKCCYHGSIEGAKAHFDSIGYELPLHHNPAEHYLKVMHENPLICDLFTPSTQISKIETKCPITLAARGSPWWLQAKLLSARSFRNMIRSPIAFYARSFQTVFFILLLGLLYLNLGKDQDSVQDRVGLLFFIVINQSMVALMNGVIVFPPERAVFLREQANGAYSPYVYAFTKIFAEMPLQILFPLVFSSCIYWMTRLTRTISAFGVFVGITVLVANTAQSYGLLVSAALSSVQTAMAIVPLTVLPFFLTGGLLANSARLDPWFNWLTYISFVRRGFIALVRNEFTKQETFECPGNGAPCLFPTGEAVLQFYGFQNDTLFQQVAVLLVSMISLRILTALSLAYHARKKLNY